MSEALSIALVSPHAWPPRDDVTHHVDAEARAHEAGHQRDERADEGSAEEG